MKIKLVCDNCGSTFEREARENNRSKKLGRRSFCSRECCGSTNIDNIPLNKRHTCDISAYASNRKDKFTGLRPFISRARARGKLVNLTVEYLKDLWLKQEGKCIYTQILLQLPKDKDNDSIYTASIDRIDSTKGYEIGNVQFISTAINFMKGQMTHEQTTELIKLIQNLGRR